MDEMIYRTTTKQDVIWRMLNDAERKHISLSVSGVDNEFIKEQMKDLEETVKRLQQELLKTEPHEE